MDKFYCEHTVLVLWDFFATYQVLLTQADDNRLSIKISCMAPTKKGIFFLH